MPTINQLLRLKDRKKNKNKSPHLLSISPLLKGICIAIIVRKPRKPNSALRKVAKVRLTKSKKVIYVYIPGEGHTLQEYSVILIKGGGPKDLPGINYTAVRGAYDLTGVNNRSTSRSKYGTRKATN